MAEHGRRAAAKVWKLAMAAVIQDTCLPIFQLPWLCAWHCLCCRYAKARKDAFLYAWQCVLFWSPLSITVLFLYLLYRPDHFHPAVDSAVLQLLTAGPGKSSLRYDLSVKLTLQNPNTRLVIRYLDVGVTAFYNGTSLGPADNSLPGSFRQGPKNTTVLHPAFKGVVDGLDDQGVASELQREQAAGTVHVMVTVYLTIMYKVLFVEEVFFYRYDCWLWFTPPWSNAVFPGNGAPCLRV